MDDLISRQAAIEQIEAIFPVDPHANECAEGVAIGAALAKQFISTLPSAQPESAKRTAEEVQNVSDSDLISRKAAIDAVCKSECESGFCGIPCPEVNALMALPSAQPNEEFEWCHDCREYDKDAHCCHRWTKAIRKTVEELEATWPEIVHCRECRHWYTGDGYNHENGAQCALIHMWVGPDDYCSYGRRKVSE